MVSPGVRGAVRTVVPPSVRRVLRELVPLRRLADLEERVLSLSRTASKVWYGGSPDNAADRELKIYSQHGEDGILLWLFSVIGSTDRRFVEFGIGDGSECNTANLARHWGWSGLLLERDGDFAAAGRNLYADLPVEVEQAIVTPETINQLLDDHELGGEFDLLSIDVDGYDYWIWNAISARPRLLVIEYNASFGPHRSVTVPFVPEFSFDANFRGGLYHGASLAALTCLSHRKGYSLVGTDSSGTNAFFIRDDCVGDVPVFTAEAGWRLSLSRERRLGSLQKQQDLLDGLPLVEI